MYGNSYGEQAEANVKRTNLINQEVEICNVRGRNRDVNGFKHASYVIRRNITETLYLKELANSLTGWA